MIAIQGLDKAMHGWRTHLFTALEFCRILIDQAIRIVDTRSGLPHYLEAGASWLTGDGQARW